MTAPIITFFNNKGGVGKTSLVYHLAWMLADLGYRVVAADLDPQANLTAAFRYEDEVEVLRSAAEEHRAHVVLIDVGPSLGAINRAALVASDQIVVPVAPDLFSLQGTAKSGAHSPRMAQRLAKATG
ncbi:MAG: ParA family protein [Pseudonocardiaceae bacterium]